jgi:hypothetical protein
MEKTSFLTGVSKKAGFAAVCALLVLSGLQLGAMPQSTGQPGKAREVATATAPPPASQTMPTAEAAQQALDAAPLHFEPNVGQAAPDVRFIARGHDFSVALMDDGLAISLAPATDAAGGDSVAGPAQSFDLRFVGASPLATLAGEVLLPATTNYMQGAQRDWRSGVANYGKVRMTGLYPGIDAVFYAGQTGGLEFDYLVAPHADASQIRLAPAGASGFGLSPDGTLDIHLGGTSFHVAAPHLFQDGPAGRQTVDGAYAVQGSEVALRIGDYDPSRPLVIDPALRYAALYGGSGDDKIFDIAADAAGNVYVVGETAALYTGGGQLAGPAPTPPFLNAGNAHAGPAARSDAFVAKFTHDAAGTPTLAWRTYMGGASSDDYGRGICINAQGKIIVDGFTSSGDFPTMAPFVGGQSAYGGGADDGFVVRMEPTGAVTASSFIGGSGDDRVFFLKCSDDPVQGGFYLGGSTASSAGTMFPTDPNRPGTSAIQSNIAGTPGDVDGFVMWATFGPIKWATYLGSSVSTDYITGMAFSGSDAYLTGVTFSTGFPGTLGAAIPAQTASPIQPSFGGLGDDFVAKISNPTTGNAGLALRWSTYFGGSDQEVIGSPSLVHEHPVIAVAANGDPILFGTTLSDTYTENFQTTSNAMLREWPGGTSTGNMFLARMQASGAALVTSTYLGGIGNNGDRIRGSINVDAAGNVWLTGWITTSPWVKAVGQVGSLVSCPGDPDCGLSLLPLPNVKFNNGQTTLVRGATAGRLNAAYLDDGSGTVTPGDKRLIGFAITNTLGFGSGYAPVCGADADCGNPLTAPADSVYLTGGDAVWSLGDAVYEGGAGVTSVVSGLKRVAPFVRAGPSNDAFDQPYQGGGDAFVAEFDPSASQILFATYLGAGGDDRAYAATLAPGGALYLVGASTSTVVRATTATTAGFPFNQGAWQAGAGLRSVLDGTTTAGSSVVGSVLAAFTPADVGKAISGGSIPAGAYITALGPPANSVTISSGLVGTTASSVTLNIGVPGSLDGLLARLDTAGAADFTLPLATVCTGQPMTLSSTASEPGATPSTYTWSASAGGPTFTTTGSFTPAAPQLKFSTAATTITVTLEVAFSNGAMSFMRRTLDVASTGTNSAGKACDAALSIDQALTPLCVNQPTDFLASVSSNFWDGAAPTTWAWTFPDGTPASSSAQNPAGVKFTPPTFPKTETVSLTATYPNAGAITKTASVVVRNSLTNYQGKACDNALAISQAPTPLCQNEPADFMATIDTNFWDGSAPTTWAWTFPDGAPATSSAQNPSAVRFAPAAPPKTEAVSLTATYPTAGAFTKTANVVVRSTLTDYQNKACAPANTATLAGPVTVCQGETVSLAATLGGSGGTFWAPLAAANQWAFTFEAGQTQTVGTSPSATSASASHTYNTLGNPTPSLTVTYGDIAASTVTVPGPAMNIVATGMNWNSQQCGIPGSAHITSPPMVCPASSAALFTGTANYFVPAIGYAWNFGDPASGAANTGTGASAAHKFSNAGHFVVAFTAYFPGGGSDTTTQSFVACAAPSIRFSLPASTAAWGSPVAFNGEVLSSDSPVVSWSWTFGDGGSGQGVSLAHTFPRPGQYTVNLQATDGNGLVGTFGATITVGGAPAAAVNAHGANSPPIPRNAPAAAPAPAAPDTSGNIVGAGTPTAGDPQTQVPAPSRSREPVGVHYTLAAGGMVRFDAPTSGGGFVWDFGDNSPVSQYGGPTHQYAAGTYTVTLTYRDDTGATQTAVASLTVAPSASAPNFGAGTNLSPAAPATSASMPLAVWIGVAGLGVLLVVAGALLVALLRRPGPA